MCMSLKCDYKILINSRLLGPCSDMYISSLVKRGTHSREIFMTFTLDPMFEHKVQRWKQLTVSLWIRHTLLSSPVQNTWKHRILISYNTLNLMPLVTLSLIVLIKKIFHLLLSKYNPFVLQAQTSRSVSRGAVWGSSWCLWKELAVLPIPEQECHTCSHSLREHPAPASGTPQRGQMCSSSSACKNTSCCANTVQPKKGCFSL